MVSTELRARHSDKRIRRHVSQRHVVLEGKALGNASLVSYTIELPDAFAIQRTFVEYCGPNVQLDRSRHLSRVTHNMQFIQSEAYAITEASYVTSSPTSIVKSPAVGVQSAVDLSICDPSLYT